MIYIFRFAVSYPVAYSDYLNQGWITKQAEWANVGPSVKIRAK